jgi:hypothetical protein
LPGNLSSVLGRRVTMNTKTSKKSTSPARKKKKPEASALTQKYAGSVLAPLGRKEAMAATELALQMVLRDGNVQRDRVRIYGPSLRIEKPKQRNGAPQRIIWVRIRDRNKGVVHEISIKGEKVTEHIINANANPPFSDEERSDAYRLISTDPQLGKIAKRKDVGIEWFSAEHSEGRVIGARFVRVRNYRVIDTITEAEIELDKGLLHKERKHL